MQWNVTVINVNRAPLIISYYPEGDPIIREDGSQEFNITCSDPDGDELLIQWYLNNTQTETNSTTYMFTPSPAGTYQIAVMVSDGLAEVWHNWTLTVTSGNSPPSIGGVTITPKPAYNDNTLTATPYGWFDPDGDPENYIYQWQKWNGAEWQNITDATSPTLDPSNFANGDQIRVMCTPYDGQDYGETKYDTVTIENRAPTITDYTPTVGYPCINQGNQQTFTVTAADLDNDPLSYEWYLNGALVSATNSYTFDATSGTSGVHNVTIIVTDSFDAQAKHTWFLTVDATLVMPFDAEDATVTDYAGYDNNGTVNGATWTADGKIGGCYIFDGTDDYIIIPHSNALDGGGSWSEITIELWIYLATDQLGSKVITKMSTSTENIRSYQIGFQTAAPANRLYGAVIIEKSGTQYYEAAYNTPLSTGLWYHVVLTYKSGDRVRLYLNGVQVAQNPSTGTLTGNLKASPDKPLYIGCRFDGGYFSGKVDEVRIYPKALTAEQISRSYNQTMNILIYHTLTTTHPENAMLTHITATLTSHLICAIIILSKTKRKTKLNRLSPVFPFIK